MLESFDCSTDVLRHERGIVWVKGTPTIERRFDGNEFINVHTIPGAEAQEVARSLPSNGATIEGVLLAEAEGLIDTRSSR